MNHKRSGWIIFCSFCIGFSQSGVIAKYFFVVNNQKSAVILFHKFGLVIHVKFKFIVQHKRKYTKQKRINLIAEKSEKLFSILSHTMSKTRHIAKDPAVQAGHV